MLADHRKHLVCGNPSCRRVVGCLKPRGLCWKCYNDRKVRKRFPFRAYSKVLTKKKATVLKMTKEGFSETIIGKFLGIPRSSVWRIKNGLGLTKRKGKQSYKQLS